MTSLEPAVTQGPLGRASMPCGSTVNGIAAGLLIKHTGGTHLATHSHTHSSKRRAAVTACSATLSQRHTYTQKNPMQPSSLKGDRHTLKIAHLPSGCSVHVCHTSFCRTSFTTHRTQHDISTQVTAVEIDTAIIASRINIHRAQHCEDAWLYHRFLTHESITILSNTKK